MIFEPKRIQNLGHLRGATAQLFCRPCRPTSENLHHPPARRHHPSPAHCHAGGGEQNPNGTVGAVEGGDAEVIKIFNGVKVLIYSYQVGYLKIRQKAPITVRIELYTRSFYCVYTIVMRNFNRDIIK